MDYINRSVEEKDDLQRVVNLLGIKSLGSESPERADLEEIEGILEGDISNVVLELREAGLVSIETDKNDGRYVSLTEEAYREVEAIGLPVSLSGMETPVETEEVNYPVEGKLPEIEVKLEVENPERYVGALAAFGNPPDGNFENFIVERHIQNRVGRPVEDELQKLQEWGYLERRNSKGVPEYRLRHESVQKQVVNSANYIGENYDGRIHRFIEEYSREDRVELTKKVELPIL